MHGGMLPSTSRQCLTGHGHRKPAGTENDHGHCSSFNDSTDKEVGLKDSLDLEATINNWRPRLHSLSNQAVEQERSAEAGSSKHIVSNARGARMPEKRWRDKGCPTMEPPGLPCSLYGGSDDCGESTACIGSVPTMHASCGHSQPARLDNYERGDESGR
jgi:hypothetical protein